VIAYQSPWDDRNTQKLVMYRQTGVLCQRLDRTSENVIFSLVKGKEEEEEDSKARFESNVNGKEGKQQLVEVGNLKKFIFRLN